MTYLLAALACSLLFFLFGMGVALVVVPREWRRYTLLFAPTLGFCFLTLLSWRCYVHNYRGSDDYATLCVAAAAVALAAGVAIDRYRGPASEGLWSRELAQPLAVGGLAFLLTSAPLLLTTSELTSYSFGNCDIADSGAVSSYLKHYERFSTEGFLGQSPILLDLGNRAIFGGCAATAVAASCWGLEIHQIQSLSVHLFFAFTVLASYAVARLLFHYSAAGATVVCTLLAISPVMMFTVCEGYQGQLATMGIASLIVLTHAAATQVTATRDLLKYLPLALALNWGFNLSYPHMLAFAQAPVIGFAGLLMIRNRSIAPVARYLLFTATVAAIVYVASPFRAECFARYLLYMGGVKAGWFLPWLSPERLFGILPNGHLGVSLGAVARVAGSVGCLAIVAWGLVKTYRDDRDTFCIAASTLLAVGAGSLLLAIKDQELGQLGGYKSYKFLSFFLPVVLMACWTGLRELTSVTRLARTPCLALVLVVILAANLQGDLRIASGAMPNARVVDRGLADVARLSGDPRFAALNLHCNRFWESMWINYFLIDKRINFLTSSYSGRQALPMASTWDLLHRGSVTANEEILHWELLAGRVDSIPVQSGAEVAKGYRLVQRRPATTSDVASLGLAAFRDGGWSEFEQGRFFLDAGSGLVTIDAPERLTVRFRATFTRGPKAGRLVLNCNGYEVAAVEHHEYCRVDRLQLVQGRNQLRLAELRTEASSRVPSEGYVFTSLDVFIDDPQRGEGTGQLARFPTPR